MNLPVTSDYLTLALRSEVSVADLFLKHHSAGFLDLPTGQLVACDPFTSPDFLPFNLSFSTGSFPVTLSVAYIKTDQRVAFATLRLKEQHPASWQLLTVGKQDHSMLREGEYFGYPVDSGTGCFMDRSVGLALHQRVSAEYAFCEDLMEEMNKTYRHTWSWLNRKFADGNLVAFSSGYGDGMYATYAGLDQADEISVIVTDFSVVPD